MAVIAEHHLPAYAAKMGDPNIGVGSFMDMFRTAAKYGQLEPKENALVQGGGGGFQINIVVNGQSLTKSAAPLTVEHQPYVPPTFDDVLAQATLAPPKFLDTADLSVNDELVVGVGDLHPLTAP
jgi:hypothetical protein